MLVAFAAALLVLLGLAAAGISARLNVGIYDQYMRLAPSSRPAEVVLVTYQQVPDRALSDALVSAAGAAGVLGVVLPAGLVRSTGEQAAVAELPTDCAPLMEFGIHRRAAGECFGRLAQVFRPQLARPPGDYLIDYSGGLSHIPRLTLQQAVDDQWLQEIARDKVVMLGRERLDDAWLATPLNGSQGISAAEYRAYALDSVLGQRIVNELGWIGLAAAIALTLLLGALVTQWLPALTGSALALLAIGLIATASWALLHYGNWWLPVTELCLAALAALLITAQNRRAAEEAEVGRIERRLSGIVARRLVPKGIAQSDDPWPVVMEFLTLHLNLARSILLELPRGKHHLREVASYRCGLDDIHERRRDWRRSPYKEAAAQRGPARPSRQFLSEAAADQNEIDYLAPLMFANQTIGFWYASFDATLPDDQRPTEHDLQLFARHTAQLLARWRADREYQQPANLFERWLPGLWPRRYRALEYSSNAIEDRVVTLERILNDLGRAALVFDMFGRLQLTNRAAEELARNEKIALYKMGGLRVLTDWCGLAETEARDVLRDVILNQESFDLPASKLPLPAPHVLHVRGIRIDDEPAPGQPPQLLGVLMELFDVSRLHQSHRWFQDLTGQFAQKVRNDLEAVALAWQRLRGELGEGSERAAGVIDRRLPAAASSMSIIQDQVQQTQNWDQSTVAPLDPRECVSAAVAQTRRQAERLRLSIDVAAPAFVTLVFARRLELVDLLAAALDLLIDDAVADGAIELELREQTVNNQPVVVVQAHNQGYGMPQEHVDLLLSGDKTSAVEADSLVALAERKFAVERWGAKVEVQSEVGMGFVLKVRLQGLELG